MTDKPEDIAAKLKIVPKPDGDEDVVASVTDRQTCYAEIRSCMKDGIAAYYRKYQDRIGDERSRDAIAHSVDGLECVINILDKYEIVKKKAESE
jgi:hypothetical protein